MSARTWLTRAMQEGDEPSAKRVVFVVGLLVIAPALLVVALFKAPDQFAVAFGSYCVSCGGAYAVSRWAQYTATQPPDTK